VARVAAAREPEGSGVMDSYQKRKSPAGTGLRSYNGSTNSVRKVYRRLPPFAREFLDVLRSGHAPNTYIFAGPNAWIRAQRRREQHGIGSALVWPKDSDPSQFDWTFLRGHCVVLAADAINITTRKTYVELAAALIGAGVRFVAATDGHDSFCARAQRSAA
jgi:hypothetical protein